jgi:ATP-dependent helicase HrpB
MSLTPLPIDPVVPDVLAALSAGSAVVLVAPPGTGKTTRVPPALLPLAAGRRVVVLEPRRIAARAAARRIAAERGWTVGDEVGWHVRFDRRFGPATRLLVVTEGILTRWLQRDPFLEAVGVVVFDELHERSLQTDLALAMTRRVMREARPDLKVVAMSATLETGPVSAFLGGCPVVTADAPLFPVTVRHLPPTRIPDGGGPRAAAAAVAAAVRSALAASDGDVLAFLPGVGEIRRAAEALGDPSALGADVLPLHGDLPGAAQDAALRRGPRRRVVLATNVAETSVTVAGVRAVVDTGLARVLRHDPSSGLDRLEVSRISRASAEQRAGRAGREGAGLCLRLWPESEQHALRPAEEPEIRRVDLAGAVLELLVWGEADVAAFGWLDPPAPAALEQALALLRRLGAVAAGGPTELGRTLAALPVHPRLGRLLVEGWRLGHPAPAALAAAALAERDPLRAIAADGGGGGGGPEPPAPPTSDSDVLDRLHALERGATPAPHDPRALDRGAAERVRRARDQLLEIVSRTLGRPPAPALDADEALLRALLAGWPDRVARRREPGSERGVLVGGRGVRLSRQSAVRTAELFVCVDLDAGPRGAHADALVRQASLVRREWLADRLAGTAAVEWDAERRRVVALRRLCYEDLVLEERREGAPDPAAAAALLAAAAAADLAAALGLERPEVASFLARARSLAAWRPELDLPAFSDDDLRARLPALAAGCRSFDELRAAAPAALRAALGHEQRAALEREAPERLTVPSGRSVALQYEPGAPPVLAVPMQALFGCRETPRVAGGRVPVRLHLLAPNGRPQQVTDDLAGFWERTWPQVRKELRGRYPKHAWPADPLSAPPGGPGRPRRPGP